MMILNQFLNLQIYGIKQLKYLQENIDLAALKKFLSKDDQSKLLNFKSISSQITIFKQLNRKIVYKTFFWVEKLAFCVMLFFWPALYVIKARERAHWASIYHL